MLGQKVLHAQSIFFNFVVGVHQTLNLFYFSVAKRPFIIRLQNVVVLTLKCTFNIILFLQNGFAMYSLF